MGQKANPIGYRTGVILDHSSKWFTASTDKGVTYADFVKQDVEIRKYLEKALPNSGVANIKIERNSGQIRIQVITSKPGVVIGRDGQGIEKLKKNLDKITKQEVDLKILEIPSPALDANLLAQGIAEQLSNRVSFRRAMRTAIESAKNAGALGVKVMCSGRLGGAEMSRAEQYHEGRVPLQTLRANISFGICSAHTTFGRIGVKVWVYRGNQTQKDFEYQESKKKNQFKKARNQDKENRDNKE